MPHYEITGMRSHRHPFYGWGSYEGNENPWGVEDEDERLWDDETAPAAPPAAPVTVQPAPGTATPQAQAKKNYTPYIVIGGVALVMLLLLK